jgi:hypothetical protein
METERKRPLPADLHASYNFINAAGELRELQNFEELDATAYAVEVEANYQDCGLYQDESAVTASLVLELREWLRKYAPTQGAM